MRLQEAVDIFRRDLACMETDDRECIENYQYCHECPWNVTEKERAKAYREALPILEAAAGKEERRRCSEIKRSD